MESRYTPYFSDSVIGFLQSIGRDKSKRILFEISRIAEQSGMEAGFEEPDNKGRSLKGSIIQKYCLIYWVDDAEKEIKVVEIRLSDR